MSKVTAKKMEAISHTVEVEPDGVNAELFRKRDGRWERYNGVHLQWDSFRYPVVEALLDHVVEGLE